MTAAAAETDELALADAALEASIEIAALKLQTATTPLRRKAAWAELQRLVKGRSPAQVERMERAREIR
jgi:hypothetical protein